MMEDIVPVPAYISSSESEDDTCNNNELPHKQTNTKDKLKIEWKEFDTNGQNPTQMLKAEGMWKKDTTKNTIEVIYRGAIQSKEGKIGTIN